MLSHDARSTRRTCQRKGLILSWFLIQEPRQDQSYLTILVVPPRHYPTRLVSRSFADSVMPFADVVTVIDTITAPTQKSRLRQRPRHPHNPTLHTRSHPSIIHSKGVASRLSFLSFFPVASAHLRLRRPTFSYVQR